MATYKELHGRSISPVSANPATSGDAGKIFYNSTDNVFRSIVSTEAWHSGANITNSPRIFSAGDGPVTAAWAAGGGSDNPNDIANTEHYDGTGWSSGTSIPAATYGAAGVGPQTAGLVFGGNTGGSITANAYEYDGSSWTSPTSMPTGRQYVNRAGTQTAALASGGSNPGPTSNTATSEYNGSSWTAGGALPVGKEYAAGTGTQTAALLAGGYFQPGGTTLPTATLFYDGSSWSEQSGALPTGRSNTQGWGTQSDARLAGGMPTSLLATSLKWDGTSWSSAPALASNRNGGTAMGLNSGPSSSGWVTGGYSPPGSAQILATEEFNRTTDVVTAAAWSSGGNMNTGRYSTGSGGTQTAAIGFGGYDSSTSGKTEEYNGTSWTENNDMGTGRFYTSGSGTQTAALAVAGRTGPGPNFAKAVVEEYNGTSWSEQNDIPSALNGMMGAGTQTAAVHFGGIATPGGSSSTGTLEYDGTNWTSGGALPTAAKYGIGVGTQTAALQAGGGALGSYYYNGTSWSDQSSNLLTQNNPLGLFFAGMSGTQASALIAGGGNPSTGVTATDAQGWNGTSWFTQPSLGTARNAGNQGGVGTATAGIAFGGQGSAPPYAVQNTTEEFTPESTSVNVKTITTS